MRKLMDALVRPEMLLCFVAVALPATGLPAFADQQEKPKSERVKEKETAEKSKSFELATFGGGCFWCTEAVFRELKGVLDVVSGYSGGKHRNPTYKAVLTGATGHAEVIQIKYDPEAITYATLLEVFWKTHDPTTPNRQGVDVGTQYRSVILYHTEQQKKLAEHYKQRLNESKAFRAPVVTQIRPFAAFYPAEKYHQDFYERNPGNRYCRTVLQPKLKKFRRVFQDKLKSAK